MKDPVRAKTWNNLTAILEQHLDADGSDCPTPNPSNGPYNEDCLYLNVYTKRFNASNLLPVIVFIHPGKPPVDFAFFLKKNCFFSKKLNFSLQN